MRSRPGPDCPSLAQLDGFVADADSAPEVGAHVAACPFCVRRVARVRENNAFLQQFVPQRPASGPQPVDVAGPDIPGYRLRRALHHGGQGVVYLAWHEATKREVAVKLPLPGAPAGAQQRRRFEREIELVASLRHPSIVTLYDSGTTPDGRLYFAMEYVQGQPIDYYARALRPPAGSRSRPAAFQSLLAIFAEVCGAVQYAHQRGIIHRDLKPSNILVDAAGRPRVLDFGVAKVLDTDLGGAAVTHTAEFVGTFAYAAPEQVRGDPTQIETRTDVYALGVLLYELLTGRLPYSVTGSVAEAVRTITTVAPPAPSVHAPHCGPELDTIVLKALAKEPERRYASVGALRRDIENYVQGLPIDAKRDSTWYMLAKTVKRYRVAFTLIALAACVLPGFTIALAVAYRQTARAEQAASRRSGELAELLAQSNVERGRLMVLAGNIPVAERLLWHEFLTHEEHTVVGRQAYWGLWELYSQQPCLATLRATKGVPTAACFAPDRPELVILRRDGVCERWSLFDFQRLASTAPSNDIYEPPYYSMLSPDAALALVGDQRRVTLWNIASRTPLHTMDWEDPMAVRFTFAPDMRWLAVERGYIQFYRLPECEPCGEIRPPGGSFRAFSFASRGAACATVTTDGMIRVWSVPDGQLTRALQVGELGDSDYRFGLTVSPDDHYLAAWLGSRVHLWDFRSLRAERTLRGGVGEAGAVRFNPDGRSLAACGSEDSRVLVWNVEGDAPAHTLLGHRTTVNQIAYSPDGRHLASTSADGTIRVWELGAPGLVARINHTATISDTSFGATDTELLAAAADGRVWSSDAHTGVVTREYRGHTGIVNHVARSRDGRRVAASAADGTIRVWDHDTGQAQSTLDTRDQRADARWFFPTHPHPHQANRIVFHPAGRLLACAGEDGNVSLWDCDTATCAALLAGHNHRVPEVDFSPDGHKLASISHDEQLILWDVATHQMIRAIRAHPAGGRTLAFSPDGRTIATGGNDACIRLWDVETGACLHTLEGHQQDVFSVRFSPDGRLLASGERSGTAEGGLFQVFLWDVASGRNLAKLPGHTNHVLAVAFSSDGRYLASCGSDRSVLVRDLTHFDRHIAGNLDEALRDAADVPASSPRVIELRAWAREVWARTAPDRP